ncbi:MAG TPA: hypothetical protein VIH90_02925 [Candidatus Saccharimonadales bacterium]
MESMDDIRMFGSGHVEDLDDIYVNPNTIRPQDTLRLMTEMRALPFSLRPIEQSSEATELHG